MCNTLNSPWTVQYDGVWKSWSVLFAGGICVIFAYICTWLQVIMSTYMPPKNIKAWPHVEYMTGVIRRINSIWMRWDMRKCPWFTGTCSILVFRVIVFHEYVTGCNVPLSSNIVHGLNPSSCFFSLLCVNDKKFHKYWVRLCSYTVNCYIAWLWLEAKYIQLSILLLNVGKIR